MSGTCWRPVKGATAIVAATRRHAWRLPASALRDANDRARCPGCAGRRPAAAVRELASADRPGSAHHGGKRRQRNVTIDDAFSDRHRSPDRRAERRSIGAGDRSAAAGRCAGGLDARRHRCAPRRARSARGVTAASDHVAARCTGTISRPARTVAAPRLTGVATAVAAHCGGRCDARGSHTRERPARSALSSAVGLPRRSRASGGTRRAGGRGRDAGRAAQHHARSPSGTPLPDLGALRKKPSHPCHTQELNVWSISSSCYCDAPAAGTVRRNGS